VNGLIGLLRFVSRIVLINMVWRAGVRVNDVNPFVQDLPKYALDRMIIFLDKLQVGRINQSLVGH